MVKVVEISKMLLATHQQLVVMWKCDNQNLTGRTKEEQNKEGGKVASYPPLAKGRTKSAFFPIIF